MRRYAERWALGNRWPHGLDGSGLPRTRARCVEADAIEPIGRPDEGARSGMRLNPWIPWLYAAPMMLFVTAIFAYPIVSLVKYSLQDASIDPSQGQVGISLANFRYIFDDPLFRTGAPEQSEVVPVRADHARPQRDPVGDPVRAPAGLEDLPHAAVRALRALDPHGRLRVRLHLPVPRRAEHDPARRRPGWLGARLARQPGLGDADHHVRHRLEGARLWHHPVPRPADERQRGVFRGRPRRRRAAGGRPCGT